MQAVSPACHVGTPLECTQSGPPPRLSGRYVQIESVVQRIFDVPFMTRVTVGPEWKRLNDAQH
jgi:hypothetical protein